MIPVRPLIILSLLAFACLPQSGRSDEHRNRGNRDDGRDRGERDHWHGDIRYFHEHDLDVWRSGHWFHGRHGGRDGWWWVVNGIWYFYPAHVAVIPDPYTPPPGTVMVQPPAPAPVAPPPAAPPPQNWYYCNNPHGYYPYVTSCAGGWQQVPANPAGVPPPG